MNKYAPHVYVIPEDRRNEQIANGFVDHYGVKGQIRVMPPAGGWRPVLETFQEVYIQTLRNYARAHVVMLIDFDDQFEERKIEFEGAIPDDLKARVFVVGPKKTPESLRRALNLPWEEIGKRLAEDCAGGTTGHWEHEQLQHNEVERQRLVQTVKPFLF